MTSEIEYTATYTDEERKAMAVAGLREAVTNPQFVSRSCGDMWIRKSAAGISLSVFAARAILEVMR